MHQNNVLKKIRLAMLDSDLSQESLGKKMGNSQQMISHWLTGYRNPSIRSLKKIADATNKPLNYFLEDSEDVNTDLENYRNLLVEKLEKNSEMLERLEKLEKNSEMLEKNTKKSLEILDSKIELILEKLKSK